MLREVLHRLLRRLPLPCVLREGGHFDLITRFTEGGVWLERDCLRCGRVRRNRQVPPSPMPLWWLTGEAAAAVAWSRLHTAQFGDTTIVYRASTLPSSQQVRDDMQTALREYRIGINEDAAESRRSNHIEPDRPWDRPAPTNGDR